MRRIMPFPAARPATVRVPSFSMTLMGIESDIDTNRQH